MTVLTAPPSAEAAFDANIAVVGASAVIAVAREPDRRVDPST
ncbi:hypothetical protein [Bradyrhizobium sp. 143]|nr:hypothetical protein [Bradyrhizobium sp. 143]